MSWHYPTAVEGPRLILFAMSKHVILLTDAHEAPAYELIEALRAAGVKTLIEGLREWSWKSRWRENRKAKVRLLIRALPPWPSFMK